MNVPREDDEEPACSAYILHFLTFYWKVLLASIPPTRYCKGWLSFLVSLGFIGLLTAFVGDLAKMFGCTIGLADSMTAITFVALGTSVPDTFASRTAAISDKHADAAIGNVTGSNSVNVFLGLGMPWLMATCYHVSKGTKYIVPGGDLSFSVTVFTIAAIACVLLLLIRRYKAGGELGGPILIKKLSAAFLILLWLIYIILSGLRSEGNIWYYNVCINT